MRRRRRAGRKDGFFSRPYDRFCLNAELTPLPFAEESFDLVICQDVIEHLLYDPMFLVQQCNRVLKKGGILILSTAPSVFSWHVTLRHLFNLTVEMGFDVAGRNPYARHHRLFSLAEVRRMVADNGFSVRRAFVRSHWYKIDGGMSLRARFAKRAVYLLDLGSAALSVLLPFLREKGGSQIWVVGEKSEFLEKIAYPRTLDMHSDFAIEVGGFVNDARRGRFQISTLCRVWPSPTTTYFRVVNASTPIGP